MTHPLAILRLFPEHKSRLYARVRIWRTVKDFQRARPDLTRDARGCCTGHQWYKNGRKLPIFCTVELIQSYLGAGCTAHELTHATIQWAERIKLKPEAIFEDARRWGKWRDGRPDVTIGQVMNYGCAEELFCYAMGEMYRQLVTQLYRRKLFKQILR